MNRLYTALACLLITSCGFGNDAANDDWSLDDGDHAASIGDLVAAEEARNEPLGITVSALWCVNHGNLPEFASVLDTYEGASAVEMYEGAACFMACRVAGSSFPSGNAPIHGMLYEHPQLPNPSEVMISTPLTGFAHGLLIDDEEAGRWSLLDTRAWELPYSGGYYYADVGIIMPGIDGSCDAYGDAGTLTLYL